MMAGVSDRCVNVLSIASIGGVHFNIILKEAKKSSDPRKSEVKT